MATNPAAKRKTRDDFATARTFDDSSLVAFDDGGREWRRVFAEWWGTLLLVIAGAGAHVAGAISHDAHAAELAGAVAPGLTVMAVIYFMGTISGAHLNPAVTFAFALKRNFPWTRIPMSRRRSPAGSQPLRF